jgi:LuxR family maltose regulon positive regulatory protein
MALPVPAPKLSIPPLRPHAIRRPRLLGRLDEGLLQGRSLSLVSAPAGFGKSTLLAEWAAASGRTVAWLSLGAGGRVLLQLAASLNEAAPDCAADAVALLQSRRPPSSETVLTGLINEIDGLDRDIILVLDDYHAADSAELDRSIAFLLDNLPSRLHLAIATREDPMLPLARLRARNLLTEIRAADLRFTPEEASDFLRHAMGLELSPDDVASLEEGTEGWIAGLQMAALSLEGQEDASGLIKAFRGSHRFALDYLAEEVLARQPPSIQAFLLKTSILERLCGPLCDALLGAAEDGGPGARPSGQEALERLERANLFLTALDGERKWFRYHGLFRELLRQRLMQARAGPAGPGKDSIADLHAKASVWFEQAGLLLDAFRHAAASGDVDRAEGIAGSGQLPLDSPDAVMEILDWIRTLPPDLLDPRPSLRVLGAGLALTAGRTAGVEEALAAAERALRLKAGATEGRALLGRIAAARATLGLTRYQPDIIMAEAGKAIETLPPEDLPFRFTAQWTMAFGNFLLGDREAAAKGFAAAHSLGLATKDGFASQLALCSIGEMQALDNRLHEAAGTYGRAILLFGEHPLPDACEAHLGLARIRYEWNDLDAAEEGGERSLYLARNYEESIDRFVPCELLLARIARARGQTAKAGARLAALAATAKARGFVHRLPEIEALRGRLLLEEGDREGAAGLMEGRGEGQDLDRARLLLAKGEAGQATAVLEAGLCRLDRPGWGSERLRLKALLSISLDSAGRPGDAMRAFEEVLEGAEDEGMVRLFLDEGRPMANLLAQAKERGRHRAYAGSLLAALAADLETRTRAVEAGPAGADAGLAEPLSRRELEVLRLVADGLSNQGIAERLFLALDTVKGHNRRIFDKLGVKRRTEAIARARGLGLL